MAMDAWGPDPVLLRHTSNESPLRLISHELLLVSVYPGSSDCPDGGNEMEQMLLSSGMGAPRITGEGLGDFSVNLCLTSPADLDAKCGQIRS